ncbi:MAG: CPBP family intramembrane metalloprotease [Ruminococcaceae bacterium]|nr:CPBP family intramembrane metalloprotease [Oscillospiraceae bacterium]
MQYFYNYQDYLLEYKRYKLKKDTNKIGFLLVLYFVATSVVSFFALFAVIIPSILSGFDTSNSTNAAEAILEDSTFVLILSGFVSLVCFFFVSLLFCLMTKADLGKVLPLQKTNIKMLYLICTFGLGICMVSNYVSELLLSIFEMFGIDASINMEFKCEGVLDIVLYYITVAVIPALVEEFAFRGVVLNTFRKHSDKLAVLVSGITFGLMHGNFTQIPFATVVGLVLGYIAVKTNSLVPGIIIHFLNNALSVTMTLISEHTALSDFTINILNVALTLIVCALGLISFIILAKKHKGFFVLKDKEDELQYKEKIKAVTSNAWIIIFTILMLSEAVLTIFLEV